MSALNNALDKKRAELATKADWIKKTTSMAESTPLGGTGKAEAGQAKTQSDNDAMAHATPLPSPHHSLSLLQCSLARWR